MCIIATPLFNRKLRALLEPICHRIIEKWMNEIASCVSSKREMARLGKNECFFVPEGGLEGQSLLGQEPVRVARMIVPIKKVNLRLKMKQERSYTSPDSQKSSKLVIVLAFLY